MRGNSMGPTPEGVSEGLGEPLLAGVSRPAALVDAAGAVRSSPASKQDAEGDGHHDLWVYRPISPRRKAGGVPLTLAQSA